MNHPNSSAEVIELKSVVLDNRYGLGNIVASHLAGLGSISGRVNFPL